MKVRFLTIAGSAGLALTASAGAEPPKTKVPQTAPAQARPAPVVLASADQIVGQSTSTDQASSAPKHRAMRVTTCRCGDQQVQAEEQ